MLPRPPVKVPAVPVFWMFSPVPCAVPDMVRAPFMPVKEDTSLLLLIVAAAAESSPVMENVASMPVKSVTVPLFSISNCPLFSSEVTLIPVKVEVVPTTEMVAVPETIRLPALPEMP